MWNLKNKHVPVVGFVHEFFYRLSVESVLSLELWPYWLSMLLPILFLRVKTAVPLYVLF